MYMKNVIFILTGVFLLYKAYRFYATEWLLKRSDFKPLTKVQLEDKYDEDFATVAAVISSAKTPFHLKNCISLIQNFRNKYTGKIAADRLEDDIIQLVRIYDNKNDVFSMRMVLLN